MREPLNFARSKLLEFAEEVIHSFVEKGYDEAAEICLSILSESIDELSDKDKTGKRLSDKEQFLHVQLNKLKREMERALIHSRAPGIADREGV